jgi:hypothetical protein
VDCSFIAGVAGLTTRLSEKPLQGTSATGQKRRIQRGFGMSVVRREADIGTAAFMMGWTPPDGIDVPKWRC